MARSSYLPFDPADLPDFYRQVSTVSGQERTLQLCDIRIGTTVLDDAVTALNGTSDSEILIVCDDTEILRHGAPLKPAVFNALATAGVTFSVITLGGAGQLHTTPEEITLVVEQLRPETTVVALGSGTIADIVKHAVYEYEQTTGAALILTVVQTANSVCAFTSGLAVLTIDGVKRTVPSRLPDRLILDTTVLAQAPREYTLGGIGDASVAASSIADYRLANMLGTGNWDDAAWKVVEDGRRKFLACDPALADPGDAGARRLATDLSACGLAMTLAGESAPLSGLEHVTSHMLDLSADHFGRPVGNHGSQCGLATALVLIAFDYLLDRVDVPAVAVRSLAQGLDLDQEQESVRRVFGPLDPSGTLWRECWSDYHAKLDVWTASAATFGQFQRSWPRYRDELRSYLADPQEFMSALAAAGHPLFFDDVPPGIAEEQARWAFTHARLMRKRISIADLLYFLGVWDEEFVAKIFKQFHTIRNTALHQHKSEGAPL